MKVIELEVVSVMKKSSSQISTTKFTYVKGSDAKRDRKQGAEWVEVEFQVRMEDEPPIMIGNVTGTALFTPNPVKLIINDPELFTLYKVGDIVPLIPAGLKPSQAVPAKAPHPG